MVHHHCGCVASCKATDKPVTNRYNLRHASAQATHEEIKPDLSKMCLAVADSTGKPLCRHLGVKGSRKGRESWNFKTWSANCCGVPYKQRRVDLGCLWQYPVSNQLGRWLGPGPRHHLHYCWCFLPQCTLISGSHRAIQVCWTCLRCYLGKTPLEELGSHKPHRQEGCRKGGFRGIADVPKLLSFLSQLMQHS